MVSVKLWFENIQNTSEQLAFLNQTVLSKALESEYGVFAGVGLRKN